MRCSAAAANQARARQLLALGQSFFYRGQLGDAEACYRQALHWCARSPQLDRVLEAAGQCLLAQLHYERGHHDDAADLLHPALELLEQHDGGMDVLAAAYDTALGLSVCATTAGVVPWRCSNTSSRSRTGAS